jgi:hypothetical protein
MLKVNIGATRVTGKWPRIEKYQNSTLRYPAPAYFPEVAKTGVCKETLFYLLRKQARRFERSTLL